MEEVERRRFNRCYHRVISGLERGGPLRMLTLTSSNDAVNPIQRDLRRLIMRLRRRSLLQDYIRVVETKPDGRDHCHMIFRGSFIHQLILSNLWSQIHQSPVVDIRNCRFNKGGKRRTANYLAKYMAKEGHRRYAWSWGWVYRGFVNAWRQALSLLRTAQSRTIGRDLFHAFLKIWRAHLRTHSPPQQLLDFLLLQCSAYQTAKKPAPAASLSVAPALPSARASRQLALGGL